MKYCALLFLSLWLAFPVASYAESTPILYSRTNIIIMRKAVQAQATPPLPWQGQSTAKTDPGLILDVEVRDAMTLYNQAGWYNLSSYSDRQGVLLAFAQPAQEPIVSNAQYAPVDILFIDKHGAITQILPNILLSELDREITPEKPILAFLFLKGGSCAQLSINPGDEVIYKIFKKPPTVLSASPQTPQPATPAPEDGNAPAVFEPSVNPLMMDKD